MANDLYVSARTNWFAGNVDWDANVIKASIIDDADYTRNLATHEDYATDVGAAAKVAESAGLSSKTNTGGTLDAADDSPTFSSVTGDPTEEIILWVDGTTDYMLANWDTSVSATPNGGDISIQWNASGIITWS